MNWNHIKTVLVFLFLIINIYLVYSSYPLNINGTSKTVFDTKTIKQTSEIAEKNFGIKVDQNVIPTKLINLKYVNSANIIYTEKFENSGYRFILENGNFSANIDTTTYSYNENTALSEMKIFLNNIGIDEGAYTLSVTKSDEGLVCSAFENILEYSVFNGKITGIFKPSTMQIRGRWYIPENNDIKSKNASLKMVSVAGVIIDVAQKMQTELTGKEITNIQYGYYVSYYDENAVSKSASAIPCYMVITDSGYKYYYDAINGKSLKQEE